MQGTDKDVAIKMAKKARDKLEKWSLEGIPSFYIDLKESMYDFFPDLPWNPPGLIHSLEFLISDEKAIRIAAALQKMYGYDVLHSWKIALKEAKVINKRGQL